MFEPNLNTVYPDVLQVILSFLNPYYVRVLQAAINGRPLLSNQMPKLDPAKIVVKNIENYSIFYQFAEDYAAHPQFRLLFPTINFRELIRCGCYHLYKRFIVISKGAEKIFAEKYGIIDDSLIKDTKKSGFNLIDIALNRDTIAPLRCININYFLYIWKKMSCPNIPVVCMSCFNEAETNIIIDTCLRVKTDDGATNFIDYSKLDWDAGSFNFSKESARRFLRFFRGHGYVTADTDTEYMCIDKLKWLVLCKNITEFTKYASRIKAGILTNEDLRQFIASKGNIEFCEWAAANIDSDIFAHCNANYSFEVIKKRIKLGYHYDLKRYPTFFTNKNKRIREVIAAGYVFTNIFKEIGYVKLSLDDLKWIKSAGYSMAGVFERVLHYSDGKNKNDNKILVDWARKNDPAINWQNVCDSICLSSQTEYISEILHAKERGENIRIELCFLTNMKLIKALVEAGLLIPQNADIDDILKESNCKSLDNIKWIHERGFRLSDYLMQCACRFGLLENVKWLSSQGIILRHDFVSFAAILGHANIIEYAIGHGIKYDVAALLADIDSRAYQLCVFIDTENYAILQKLADKI